MIESDIGSDKDPSKYGLINLIFGYDSILQRKHFVNVVMSKRCNWLLDDHTLRKKLQFFNDDEILG